MAINPAILIASTQLAAAATSIGGPTSPAQWLLKRTVFTNTDTASRTITVHRVPNGGSALAANKVINAFVLSASGSVGDTYVAIELTDMVLASGDKLYALSDSANKVNVTASGFTF